MKKRISPLDVMLKNVRHYRELERNATGDDAVKYRRLAERCERDVAPYLHPREIRMRRGETLSQAILRAIEGLA
jgi:hypothetical protein